MWRAVLALIAAILIIVIGLAMQMDIEFKNPKLQRIWSLFACSLLGLFVVWMIILLVFFR